MIVFIGGSRSIKALPEEVKSRIDSAMAKCQGIVVGDAPGIDAEVQRHLHSRNARNVTVYCAKGGPRNNIGDWPVVEVVAKARARTFEFYTAKDRAMADAAGAGLVAWDGESQGTLLQCHRLASKGKFVAIYNAKAEAFTDVQTPHNWTALVERLSAPIQQELSVRIDRDRAAEERNLFQPAAESRG
jgi:hypothetical protein